jgi:FHS family L-fucose permease-like MFS transporter
MTDKSAGPRMVLVFVYVTLLFFTWGFVTNTIDPLVASVREVFHLQNWRAMLTQLAFFAAYGFVSVPAAGVVARRGAASSIVIALAIMVGGCLVMPLATALQSYVLILVALFIIGAGITLLQVAANPLAAVLGRPQLAHFRLTFAQAFNSLGTVFGPYFASSIMLTGGVFAAGASGGDARSASLDYIAVAFVGVAGFVTLIALLVWLVRARIGTAAPPALFQSESVWKAFRSRPAVLGGIAIFLYVGAEVAIASSMILFLISADILGVSAERGGHLLAWFYWGSAMAGRFVGSLLLAFVPARRVLAGAAIAAAILCTTVSVTHGMVAAVAALAVGFFNSIMFPTIFTLTLERSTAPMSSTSGLLCFSIVGGAILPPIMGLISDYIGLSLAFLLPMLAYLCIATFASRTSGTVRHEAAQVSAQSVH